MSRRNGKVARLPRKIRDHVNEMLEDGETYPVIINWLLAPLGVGLSHVTFHFSACAPLAALQRGQV